jgi:DNA-binding MarR family transcriptional regulator
VARAPKEVGQLIHEVNALLHAVGHQGVAAETSALSHVHEAGLTLPQMITLTTLRHDGPAAITSISERLGLSMSAASTMVQRLVEQEFVTRTEDPDDRRHKRVELTKEGAAVFDRLLQQRSIELSRGVSTLPPDLRDELLDVCTRVVDHLRLRLKGPR